MVFGETVLGLLFLSSKVKERHVLVHSPEGQLGGEGITQEGFAGSVP